MLIVVNATANAGNGAARWARVEPELRAMGLAFDALRTQSAAELPAAIDRAIRGGHDAVAAAGGDGSVNALLNALMDPATDRPRADLALGAVGLGSSNDFHKPFAPEAEVAGCPVRLRADRASAADVGKATLELPGGGRVVRYFLLNASVGLVAEGNAFFNRGDAVIRWLKRRSVEVAILYAAVVNIARFRPLPLQLELDGGAALALPGVACVGILKRVHFAGGMRYDTSVTADDGRFDVNVWGDMARLGVVRTIGSLYAGRFRGLPRTSCFRASRVRLTPATPTHVELDGEIVLAASAEMAVLPRAVRVCGA